MKPKNPIALLTALASLLIASQATAQQPLSSGGGTSCGANCSPAGAIGFEALLAIACLVPQENPANRRIMENTCNDTRAAIDRLTADCHQPTMTSETLEWEAFRRGFTNPCQPIPARYLNPANRHFGELIQLIAPQIVMDPADEHLPQGLPAIISGIDRTNGSGAPATVRGHRRTLPFRAATAAAMIAPQPMTRSRCSTPLVNGQCCGMLNDAPLYFDVNEHRAPSSGGSGTSVISVGFAITHRAGTVLDLSQALSARTGGVLHQGTHLFDSEEVQFDYARSETGFVSLDAMRFSRHALGTESFTRRNICNNAQPAGRMSRRGPHPTLFQAVGGHALYMDARSRGDQRTLPHSRSAVERWVESDLQPVEGLERDGWQSSSTDIDFIPAEVSRAVAVAAQGAAHLVVGDRTVADTQADFVSGRCVTSTNPQDVRGIGSLWNNTSVGINRDGYFGSREADADVCVQYGPGSEELRSIRYLNGWLDQDHGALSRFGCGHVAGE